MPKYSKISLARLETAHPSLQRLFGVAIERVNLTILCGHRTEEQQEEAFMLKRSTKHWPHSKHNAYPSLAVDVAPYFPDIRIDWEDLPAFGRMAGYLQRIAHDLGFDIRWGGDWDGDWRTAGHDPDERFIDGPHIELIE